MHQTFGIVQSSAFGVMPLKPSQSSHPLRFTSELSRPLRLLMNLVKAKKGEMKAGHKYVRRVATVDPATGKTRWSYEYSQEAPTATQGTQASMFDLQTPAPTPEPTPAPRAPVAAPTASPHDAVVAFALNHFNKPGWDVIESSPNGWVVQYPNGKTKRYTRRDVEMIMAKRAQEAGTTATPAPKPAPKPASPAPKTAPKPEPALVITTPKPSALPKQDGTYQTFAPHFLAALQSLESLAEGLPANASWMDVSRRRNINIHDLIASAKRIHARMGQSGAMKVLTTDKTLLTTMKRIETYLSRASEAKAARATEDAPAAFVLPEVFKKLRPGASISGPSSMEEFNRAVALIRQSSLPDADKQRMERWLSAYTDQFKRIETLKRQHPDVFQARKYLNDITIDFVGMYLMDWYEGRKQYSTVASSLRRALARVTEHVEDIEGYAKADKDRMRAYESYKRVQTELTTPQPEIAKRLRQSANGLVAKIHANRNPAIKNQNLTHRRAGIIVNMAGRATAMDEQRKIMNGLAARYERGEVPLSLSGIKSRSTIETVLQIAHTAERYQGRIKEGDPNSEYDQIDQFNSLMASDHYNTLRNQGVNIRSMEQALQMRDDLLMVGREWEQFREDIHQSPVYNAQLQALEHSLIGRKIPGFFATSPTVANAMVDNAMIETRMSVLEPSAGKGNIANVIAERHPDADLSVIEQNSTLRQILELQGHDLVDDNTLNHRTKYDRVIMNPPFENFQDIDHVEHAFRHQLKPGGRLVAIMSEGPFFRNDSKARAFRDWLEAHGGISEPVERGNYGNDHGRSTNVATRMVIIDKPRES